MRLTSTARSPISASGVTCRPSAPFSTMKAAAPSPVTVATTDGEGDHPLLIENKGRVFISWLSKGREGYRLIELGKGA